MKGCFTTLLLALIAAIFAAFFGRSWHREGIETALNERVASGLKASYPELAVKYDHFTAMVVGKANPDEADAIKAKIKELALGNGRVYLDIGAIPGPGPIPSKMPNFTIFREGNKLTLNGQVDSIQTMEILARAARGELPNLEIVNNLQVGENTAAFPSFGEIINAIPVLMASAENGKVKADVGNVEISGLVADEETRAKLRGLFSPVKWNNAKVVDLLTVKPIERTIPSSFVVLRVDDKLSLKGSVDSADTRAKLGTAAELPGLVVDNQLEISERVMALPVLEPTLVGISKLVGSAPNGKLEVNGQDVTLSGTVNDKSGKDQVLGLFAGAPWAGWKINDQLKIKPTKPSSFMIVKDGGTVTLTGEVDSPRTKNMLGNAAQLDGVTVNNQLKVNEELMAFPEFGPILGGIPTLLGAVKSGKFDFKPDQVIMSGTAIGKEAKNQLGGLFSSADWKGPKFKDEIKVPGTLPPAFTIIRDKNKLVVTGKVNSEEVKDQIGRVAKINGATVDNQIQVSNEVMAIAAVDSALAGIPSLLNSSQNGRFEFSPEQLVLSGAVVGQSAKDGVMAFYSTEKVKGLKVVDQITVMAPKSSPTFSWKQDDPKKAVLGGNVPNEEIRVALVAAAKKRIGPEGEVVDQIKVDGNTQLEPWLSALPGFAAQSLPRVEKLMINIDPQKSSVAGTVPDSSIVNEVSLAFSGINPPGKLDLQLELAKVEPKPPVMPARTLIPEVEVTGTGQNFKIVGRVPDKKIHDSIVNTVIGIKNIDKVDRGLKIGEDVKDEDYLAPLPEFIGQFYGKSIKDGSISLKNKELTLRGLHPNTEAKTQALALTEPLKKLGVKINDNMTVAAVTKSPEGKPMEDPKQEKVDFAKGELHSIFFNTGEFHMRENQNARASKLLQSARGTKGKIVIDGFADERGSDDLNVYLSEERAKRIKSFLIDNGIDESRIVSVIGRGGVPNGKSYQQHRRSDVRILE